MTLTDLQQLLRYLPPGASVTLRREDLEQVLDSGASAPAAAETESGPELTWRERIWLVPAETRLGRAELLEVVGRTASWLYAHTAAAAPNRIPHRKFGGELVFVVGEIRTWIRSTEESVSELPMQSTVADRRLEAV